MTFISLYINFISSHPVCPLSSSTFGFCYLSLLGLQLTAFSTLLPDSHPISNLILLKLFRLISSAFRVRNFYLYLFFLSISIPLSALQCNFLLLLYCSIRRSILLSIWFTSLFFNLNPFRIPFCGLFGPLLSRSPIIYPFVSTREMPLHIFFSKKM